MEAGEGWGSCVVALEDSMRLRSWFDSDGPGRGWL